MGKRYPRFEDLIDTLGLVIYKNGEQNVFVCFTPLQKVIFGTYGLSVGFGLVP